MKHILFTSGGNDSVALVQYAAQNLYGLDVTAAYSNTGWASSWWPLRMQHFRRWVESLGFQYAEIPSEGMEALVERKSAFPANGMQFCTTELKIIPAQTWLDSIDPDKNAVCMIGIRREESPKRRNWPILIPDSPNHGGRDLIAPLVELNEAQRNNLILRAGWRVLPHRSKECSPCVNLNRADGRALEEPEINRVERMEAKFGLNMFRPKRFHSAVGIREVIRWANHGRGKYNSNQISGCDSGMCGD